jgi:hypothetical protein
MVQKMSGESDAFSAGEAGLSYAVYDHEIIRDDLDRPHVGRVALYHPKWCVDGCAREGKAAGMVAAHRSRKFCFFSVVYLGQLSLAELC